jgi:hypothetical protein
VSSEKNYPARCETIELFRLLTFRRKRQKDHAREIGRLLLKCGYIFILERAYR